MDRLTVSSPAKINLYLRILGRRKDGYHDLITVFHRISLHDTLTVRKKAVGIAISCDDPSIPVDERNLIWKAYCLMKSRFPGLGGVSVRLKKRIPAGGGLGGGSSNAAAFMKAVNRLYGLKASRKTLLELGKKLGADVPFFVYEVNQAVAAGRGDIIRPRPCKGHYGFLLVIDNKELSTKKVYESLPRKRREASLTNENATVRMLCAFLDRQKWPDLIRLLQNDLENPAFRLRPSIKGRMEVLVNSGFEAVRMSGSGPTVFIMLPYGKIKLGRLAATARHLFPSSRIEIARTY